MSELESEKSAAETKNEPGQGLKIFTPDQMLSRLPVFFSLIKSRKLFKKNLKTKLGNYCILCTVQKN